MLNKLARSFLIAILVSLPVSAQTVKEPPYFHPSGLPGTVTDVAVQPVTEPKPLPPDYVSADADLKLMAAWALRHLIHNPRPALNYEPVFFIRPLHVPPAPEGHDSIVPGDTDCRMDWEFIFMREISGSREGLDVEQGLRRRIPDSGRLSPDSGMCQACEEPSGRDTWYLQTQLCLNPISKQR